MMKVISALKGFGIFAKDGRLGSVADFLFDNSDWKVRWLVVECGDWRKGRKVLIHPSAVSDTRLEEQRFEVKLTMAEVADSPQWDTDLPVSQQMEEQLYSYYGWDPEWGAPYLGGTLGAMASPLSGPPFLGLRIHGDNSQDAANPTSQDTHLRSFVEIVGYHIHATDGEIGHVENFMLEDADWSLRYFIVDTSNWWFGTRVLIAPSAVVGIDWFDRHVRLNVSRGQVETVPLWDPLVAFDQIYAKRLHHHYGWPGSEA